jgi:glycosyltransferase involved in cell wall biosynthesis
MKALLLANTDWYLYNFRRALARRLQQDGYDLTLVCPPGPYADKLRDMGFTCMPFDLPADKLSPLKELKVLLGLIRLYQRERPSIVHHFTIRCVLYGSIAARLVGGISVVNAVTGIGHVFTADGPRARLLRRMVGFLYRLFLTGSRSRAIFQNRDDLNAFVQNGMADGAKSHLIPSSGVDCSAFRRAAERNGPAGKPVNVLFASRLIREKGVAEYLEAARVLRSRNVPARFLLAGDIYEQNPSSLSRSELQSIRANGVVDVLGHVDDIRAVLADTDIVVLPSYREGCPRILVEAAAMGIPIVATDVPGCRVVVEHDVNGYLVPPRDVSSLAGAIEHLVSDEGRRRRLGEAGRLIAVNSFDENIVLDSTLRVYRQLTEPDPRVSYTMAGARLSSAGR